MRTAEETLRRRAKIVGITLPILGVFWVGGWYLETQEQANVARGCQILQAVTGDESANVTCKQHVSNLRNSAKDDRERFSLCVNAGQQTYKESFRQASVPSETTDDIVKACTMMLLGISEARFDQRGKS